jgi:hypothetical protein
MAIAAGVIAQLVKLTLIAVHELPAQRFGATQADVAADRMLRGENPGQREMALS